MSSISSIIITMLWIFIIIYACVKSGVYDPYELTNSEYFNDSFYFLIFIGLYSFAILINIAFPSPFTLNGLLQSISTVLYNISLFLAVCYLVIKEGYNAYNLRDNDWVKTDSFWRIFLLTQVVVILLSITWPYSFSVSRTVWFQLVIPILNQIITLLGGLLFVVYFLYDPYDWKESPWFSYHILLWFFVLLYAVTYILNSFPTAITNGLLFPTDIMKIQNTTGVSLTSLMYIDMSGNKMIYDVSGNPLSNNNSIYLVPKPNSILIGTDTNSNVYGFATLDYIRSILLIPIGRSINPYGMYVTGNNITPVSSQGQPNTKNIIPSVLPPTNFILIEDNLPMPTSMIIANCNPCDAGPSAITLTSSSTSKTFTLGSYKDNNIQSILLGVNTLPSIITGETGAYTSAAILNLGQIRINEYIACYAKHADGTQSCSIIYNCGRVKVYDLMNSAGTIRFFTVPAETTTPTP
jgi:hypothetical protein